MRICMGCMEFVEDDQAVCPLCGYARNTPPKEAYHMPPESILHGKYIVGRILGYGGFGVTYLGWDAQLERKVAIKEYLPSDFATRMPGDVHLTVYANEAEEQFAAGLRSFLDEAQRLAKFNSKPGIVDIYDSFSENYTAYIVMQYLEGQTVKEILIEQKTIPYERSREILLAILEALDTVHQEGIIHRDVSPDNIFITKDGEIKLLDFGAARYATTFHSKSLSVILKPGYAPEEQYRSHGSQGPWTDVYASAATFYKMLTGITPEESMERAVKDNLAEPSKLKVEMPKSAENALLNAMNIRIEDRTQSAREFREELLADGVERKKVTVQRSDTGKIPKWFKGVLAGAAALAVVGLALAALLPGTIQPPAFLQPEGMVYVPGVLSKDVKTAEEEAKLVSLSLRITGKAESDKTPLNMIMYQDPLPGRMVETGSILEVQVSAGPEQAAVPDVREKERGEAEYILTGRGFRVKIKEEYHDTVPGAVISQDAAPNTMLDKNSIITLTVSKGLESVESGVEVEMPDLTGLDYDFAKNLLNTLGLYIKIGDEEYRTDFEKGAVIEQEAEPGSILTSGSTVEVVRSLGFPQVDVPDVEYENWQDALEELAAEELEVTVRYAASDVVEFGLVMEQDPAPYYEDENGIRLRRQIDEGGTVALTVSTGDYILLTNVEGQQQASATARLTDLGFQVTVREEYSSQAIGRVISQSPKVQSGEMDNYLAPGATVTLTVSKGPEPVSEPAVVAPRAEVTPPNTDADKNSGGEAPEGADTPAGGDTSTQDSNPIVRMPNLVGYSVEKAMTRLQNAGFTGVLDVTWILTSDPDEDRMIVWQNVTTGDTIHKDMEISVEAYRYSSNYWD